MHPLLTRLPGRALLLGLVALLACARQEPEPDDSYLVYASYRPLLMTRAALASSVASVAPQPMRHPGKIFLRGAYVFVNEQYEGIHIIDNRDPANPRPVSFLRIPGNVDLAVRGNLLYADNGPDLVTIDISDPTHAKLASRVTEAFQELPMPEAGPLEEACQPNKRPTGTVVIGWRKLAPGEAVPTKIKNPRGSVLFFSAGVATASPSARADVAGKGGSLARFAVLNQALYIVDDYSLRLYDLQNPATPVAGPRLPLGFGIETIFPQDHYLFLGTQRGMYIFDVATATAPKQLSFYSHVVSCDPVVVDGRYAYVTLRSGRTCGGGANVLEVIDLNNLSAPSLARSYPMTRPQGLGAEHNKLYVCDDGLQSFDTSQSPILKPLQHFNTTLTDVIPNGDYLLAIGPGGLYQYRINGAVLEQVSRLAITPES